MAPEAVRVCGLHPVGQVGEERHVGEAELGEHLVARRVGANQLLVGLTKVRLEAVDRLQPHRDPASAEGGGLARDPGQRLDQRWIVGGELDGVAIGLGSPKGQIGVADHEFAPDQPVAHAASNPPIGNRAPATAGYSSRR